jgi:thiamine pyrophosphokinase
MIIGAAKFSEFYDDFFTTDFVIAADGGFLPLFFKGENLPYHLVVGDFDSIKHPVPQGIEVMKFPAEKDESDLELAVCEAIKREYNRFYIYGVLGGRLDHTLASIAVMTSVSRKGYECLLLGDNEIITAVTDGTVTLNPVFGKTLSVFAVGEHASGVTLSGLKYPLDNANLDCFTSRGLSNEFISEKAVIEVRNGTLIIVMPRQ